MAQLNWRNATISDLETLQKCALENEIFANNYGAVNSILYQKKYCAQIAFEYGCFFEKLSFGGCSYFSFPHKLESRAQTAAEAKNAIVALAKEAENLGLPLTFGNITAQEKGILLELYPSAKVTATPDFSDYIYSTERLASLAGKKYSKKRNHIHQFNNKYTDFRFELLGRENFSAVREIEEKWLEESKAAAVESGTLQDLESEKEIIFTALENFDTFRDVSGMSGGILFIKGNPAAFCMASLLSRNITDVHFEKCLYAFGRDGGYAVINNEFAKTVQTEFLNREEDLGIEGLRKAKLSYYPEMVLEKFSVEC